MMKHLAILTLLSGVSFHLFGGGSPQYPVRDIPEGLLKKAHVVYRENKAHFEILAIDRATFTVRQVITILDKTGDRHAHMATSYDNLRKVTAFTATTYDKDGNEIEKLKKSDINDRSYIGSGTLYDDSRIMSADLRQKQYPYTVAYDIVIAYKYLYSIPDWIVQEGENDAIQYSEYKITSPKALRPRYKQLNFDTPPSISQTGDVETMMWAFIDLPAIEFESLSKGYLDISPIIKVSPNKFRFEDYEGSMESWDAMALWQNKLNENRNTLSAERINEIRQLVADQSTDEEKIKTVYEYMQNRTRYVSIQLGIGGFQPFAANVVDETGYGDCKALSFYTKSLLEAAGVNAYYTWVYGGPNPPEIDKSFPDDSFNHIILCVPTEQDTVWLECTSQQNPMGYLGKFTGDRDVLVINENGGKIVHTPSYDHENNAIITSAEIKIDEEGNARASIHTLFKGKGYEHNDLDSYLRHTEKDHKDWLNAYIPLSNYQIERYEFKERKQKIPEIDLDLDLNVRKLASISNKRIFFTPNLFNINTFIPPKNEDRNAPVYIASSQLLIDSIQFNLPENFHLEYLPETTEIQTEFGSLKTEYSITEGNLIQFKREFRINKGKYSPDKYNEVVNFFKEVNKVDKKKVVLTKST